jgi:hypothetical protein
MRKTFHGCLVTKIYTIQFLIGYPAKRIKISRNIPIVSSKLLSLSLKSGNKTGLLLNLCLYYSAQKLLISNWPAGGKQDRQNSIYGCAQQDLKPIFGEYTEIISKISTKDSEK